MAATRKMTATERRALVFFVLAREWVLFTIGVLMVCVSLLVLSGAHMRERSIGVILAILLLVAMGLYLCMRTRRDLLAGQVAEDEVEVAAQSLERHEGCTFYYISDVSDVRYEVSSESYERVKPGDLVCMVYAPSSRIVLSLVRRRKL